MIHIFNTILDVIFPVNCVSCGKRGSDLCLDCLANFQTAERETAAWIFPLFDYRYPPTKKAIWHLKYNGKKRLAKIFAEIIYGKIIEELSDLKIMQNFTDALLIPIPLSNKRYRERGYNQTELICKKLIKLDEKNKNFILAKNVLIKIKETEHQARIRDRKDRFKNLANTFTVKNIELIKNKNIILIDDVTTTGATLNEARKTLKNFGAKKIIAFTIAH